MRRRHLLAALPLLSAGCRGGGGALTRAQGTDDGGGGGIGGTGLFASSHDPDDGGIGGTGVFGTVSGLGSLRVNGLLLETSGATAVETLAGAPVLPGDTVAAEAVRRIGARLLATRLAAFHPLIGPLEQSADGGWMVLGTRVLLAADTPVRDTRSAASTPSAALRPGRMVAVSGLWRNEAVVATALRLLPDAPPFAVLRGLLRAQDGAVLLGGTRVDAQGLPAAPPVGRFVTLHGRPAPRGLAVEAVEERPLAVFSGRVSALSVEGFIAPNRDEPGHHLSGFGLPFDPSSPVSPRPGVRQLLLGRYRDLFRVDQGMPLPADDADRRRALAGSAAAAANARWLARP
jgi:Domain of unknown function (DUF5666)